MTLPTLAQDTLVAAHRDVLEHCWQGHPKEVAGVIWEDAIVSPFTNIRAGARGFHVTPQQLHSTLATRPDRTVLSIYHSHPSGIHKPSAHDVACMAEWDKAGIPVLWSIAAIGNTTSTIATYRFVDDGPQPYHRLIV